MSDFKKGPTDPGPRLIKDVEMELWTTNNLLDSAREHIATLEAELSDLRKELDSVEDNCRSAYREQIATLETELDDLRAELKELDSAEDSRRFAYLTNAELVDWFRLGKVETRDFIALAVARLERVAEVERLRARELQPGTFVRCHCGSAFPPKKQTGMSVPEHTCPGCRRAEAAEARVAELEAAVSDALVVIADMAPGETVLIARLRTLLAKGGAS